MIIIETYFRYDRLYDKKKIEKCEEKVGGKMMKKELRYNQHLKKW